MNKKGPGSYSILGVFILAVILNHLFAYTGHYGYDDLHYAKLSADLLKGSFHVEDHFAYRLPVILLTSLFYLLFGISDFSSSLPALLITLCILLIVFNILREHGPGTTFIGLSLTTFSNWFLFYSDKLMPDIYVALTLIWALALLHRYKYKSNKNRPALFAFLFALALLLGFMAKGTIVLVLPLLAFLIITDIIRKRDLSFWGYSLLSGVVLLALYFSAIWIFTGSPLKRFEVITSNSYLNICSYDQQSLRILLKRIFTGFFALTIYQSMATSFIFIFAFLFQRKGLRYFRLDDSFSFFLVSAVILLLSSNFMSISLSSYSPMCLDPRHYLFLVPVAAIPASRILTAFLKTKQAGPQILTVLFCMTLISFFLRGDSFRTLYLPLTVLFGFHYVTGIKKQTRVLFIILFAIVLLLGPLDMVSYARQVQYRTQRETVKRQVLENYPEATVVTDEVQKRLLEYYNQFRDDPSRSFLSFKEVQADTSSGNKILLLLNRHTRYLSGMELNDLPFYARNISSGNRLVYEHKELGIKMFDMSNLIIPEETETAVLSTFNDFENPVPFWNQKESDISEQTSYAGTKANRLSEFSATFDYPLDSLVSAHPGDLLVQVRLFCFSEDQSSAKVIVSLENNSGSYVWEALEINRYLKAYSNWWPVSFEVPLSRTDMKTNSHLKVYLWNAEKQEVWIDNFGIRVYATPG
ncbi:MAG: glycosyltransferase family 39 protein [Bacteroidales bacterium]|nr:glycosyltransferase family 39 protein [Bacteroidales bacterium]